MRDRGKRRRAAATGVSVLAAVCALSAVGAVGAVPAAGAAGSGPQGSGSGWRPYRSQPFAYPAGAVCPFGLKADIVKDGELVRDLATDSAGKVTEQEFTGPLTLRFTNTATGSSAVRAVPGTARIFYHPDGSQTWYGDGHLALGIRAGNPYQPAGYYILNGHLVLQLHPDGVPQLITLNGSSENLCHTLSG